MSACSIAMRLEGKNTLSPEVLDAVRSGLAAGTGLRFKVVANLPYHVATPVIANLLVHPEFCPALMVVTIQRELADRMCAPPASSAYGAVSVRGPGPGGGVDRSYAAADGLLAAAQGRLGDRRHPARTPPNARRWATSRGSTSSVRRVFLHRRKYIRHVLAGLWRDQWTKSDVDAWLESQGFSGQLRAESLNVEEFLSLAHALESAMGGAAGSRD